MKIKFLHLLPGKLFSKGIFVGFFTGLLITTAFSLGTIVHGQSTPLVYACVQNKEGEIRIVSQGQQCRKDETPITWPQSIPSNIGGSSKLICPQCNFTEETPNEFDVFPSKNIDGAFIPVCNLSQYNLSNFSIQNIYGTDCTFNNIIATATNFSNSDLKGSTFNNALANNANFTNTNLSGLNNPFGKGTIATSFNGATLTNANFSNANLDSADFTNANLTGATFSGAIVTNLILSNTTCPDGSNSDTNSPAGTCPGL